MPHIEVARLLICLETLKDSSPVQLKDSENQKILIAATLRDILGTGAKDASAAITEYIVRVIRDASGADAANEAEGQLRAWAAQDKCIAAGRLRELLERHRLPPSVIKGLETFVESMPDNALASIKFEEMPLQLQVAVMEGVQKAAGMMETMAGLPEIEEGELKPDSKFVSLGTVQKVQKTLAQATQQWAAALLAGIPRGTSKHIQITVSSAIHKLLQATKPKLLTAMLEALTMGVAADIFTVQSFVIRELKQFADLCPIPAGIDCQSPALQRSLLDDLLFESACRYIRVQKGISVPRLLEAEAKMLVHTDPRIAFGSLQRMYLNSLLEEVPDVADLRARANVKGFDVDGLHADFIRDCIAHRYSFTVMGFGKLENAVEREQAVAAGKRDLEFYEAKKREMDGKQQAVNAEPAQWERPEARFSASMTEDDLNKARSAILHAIPEPTLRMAVTAIANAAGLSLLASFFGKDPGAGVYLQGSHKAVKMQFSPADGTLSVSAMLFHDGLKAMARINDEPDELALGRISFTQMEYTAQLKPKRKKNESDPTRWRVSKLTVDNVGPYLVPPPPSDEQENTNRLS